MLPLGFLWGGIFPSTLRVNINVSKMSVLRIVGHWILESNINVKIEYDNMCKVKNTIKQGPHFCILELTGTCPECEGLWEYRGCVQDELKDIEKWFISFPGTCRDAAVSRSFA